MGAGLVAEFFGLQDARIELGYGSAPEALSAVGKVEADGRITWISQLQPRQMEPLPL